MIEGLEQGIDPGAKTEGNGYEAANLTLVRCLAIGLNCDPAGRKILHFLKEALGEEMHHTYVAVKEAEYIRVMRSIPEIDYDWLSLYGLAIRVKCPNIKSRVRLPRRSASSKRRSL